MSEPGPKRHRSVASRARLYLVATTAIALAVAFGVFAVAWSQYSIGQRKIDRARQVTALAGGQAANGSLAGAGADARARLLKVQAGLMGAALFVTDTKGTVLRATTTDAPASLPIDRLAPMSASAARGGVLRTSAGVRVLVVSAPIDESSVLVAVEGLREVRQAQAGILIVAAIAVLAAVIAAYVAGGLLARRLTAPLVRLRSAAEQVSAGAFGTQVAEEADAETASLARSFNRMSRRVADAYAAQKAFVADVSHEIRTPITSIRGFAEAMLDGTVDGEEGRRRALTVIRDESERIGEVAATLLALSELDAGAVELAREPVDLAVLGDALRGRFTARAGEREVRLEIALSGSTAPIADSARLLQATSALIDNAIAHTPAGGTVRVTDSVDTGEWHLDVDDSGPGVPPERRADVFGRFARLDESRSARSGGAGLGLSICERLVALMGGQVSVTDSDLGGARFRIALPFG